MLLFQKKEERYILYNQPHQVKPYIYYIISHYRV